MTHYTQTQDFILLVNITGRIPHYCLPVQKALWTLFAYYASSQVGASKVSVPSTNVSKEKRFRTRLLSADFLWNLFRDFGVCPSYCRYFISWIYLTLHTAL